MSGLHYVFVKRLPRNERYLLCFESRYTADELFRTLQNVKGSDGNHIFKFKRVSSQLWSYEAGSASIAYPYIAQYIPAEYNYRYCSIYLTHETGVDSAVVPNPIIGPDWVSGNEFFIRNRRQPDLYWYVHNDHRIHISEYRRTKFLIRGTEFGDEKKVFIRSDPITIEPVSFAEKVFPWKPFVLGDLASRSATPGNATPAAEGESSDEGRMFVTKELNSQLGISPSKEVWKFGDLFSNFGVVWEGEGDISEKPKFSLAVYTESGGDEWELV
ncbi:hypothetical protein K440DRAFT_657311 [Wilcoxina mikolae CBS 423.85]|nr:hypothetical protein K440DRAFT_657311 [Wilcoxina mikolae CBS 423.85]